MKSTVLIRCLRLTLLLPLLLTSPITAQDSRREGLDFFEKHIRPLLAKHCYECHSAESSSVKGNLKLDTRTAVLAGGDSGPALVAGKPDDSLLLKSVMYDNQDLQMPPSGRLSDDDIAALRHWIEIGAPDPRTGTSDQLSKTARVKQGRQHWSFQPVRTVAVPAVTNTAWVRSEIDQFILRDRNRLESVRRLMPVALPCSAA